MSREELWTQLHTFIQAVPPWLNALPLWLTSLLILMVGLWIGRGMRVRRTRLMQLHAARDAIRLTIDAARLDPTFRQVPGLGAVLLEQLKRHKRLTIPRELEDRLKGQDTVVGAPATSAPVHAVPHAGPAPAAVAQPAPVYVTQPQAAAPGTPVTAAQIDYAAAHSTSASPQDGLPTLEPSESDPDDPYPRSS